MLSALWVVNFPATKKPAGAGFFLASDGGSERLTK